MFYSGDFKYSRIESSLQRKIVVILTRDIFAWTSAHSWIGEAMKPFLASILDLLDKCQTYLSVTAQRSRPEVRYRQDLVIISAVVLVVLVLFLIGAYVITRF
jgi:hypothetical protein